RQEAVSEVPDLVLVAVYLLAGLYHLWFYRQRRGLKEYLWVSLGGGLAAPYCFLRTPWEVALRLDFLLLKTLEHALLYVVPACMVQFLWPALGMTIGRFGRLFQAIMLAVGAAVLLAPGLDLALRLLPWLQACFFLISAGTLVRLVGA